MASDFFLPMLTKKWFIALLIWEGSLVLFFLRPEIQVIAMVDFDFVKCG